MKEVMTNVTLPQNEDNALKVRAIEAGMSKRSLATQITREWLRGQDVKSRIAAMLNQISHMPDNNEYFQAVEDLIDGSVMLTECRVKKEVARSFESEYKLEAEEIKAREKIVNSLKVLGQVFPGLEHDPDLLSAAIVESYFVHRRR